MAEDEKLTKVHVDLPNHWATSGESVWACDLGGDIYEIRNVPFYAYDLNFRDVVEAVAESPDLKPEVRRVVRRSGNRTMRIFFNEDTTPERRRELLETLKPLLVSYEGATERLFALDIEPGADLAVIRAELDVWEREGWAEYETCEARVAGSFDDADDEGGS